MRKILLSRRRNQLLQQVSNDNRIFRVSTPSTRVYYAMEIVLITNQFAFRNINNSLMEKNCYNQKHNLQPRFYKIVLHSSCLLI